MRIAFHEVAVLEDARLTFFAVDHEVLRLSGSSATALPLRAGGEERASPALQARGLHGFDHLVGGTVEGAGEGTIRAVSERVVDVVRIHQSPSSGEHLMLMLPERM